MIALDTNILIHARRTEMAHHAEARQLLAALAEGDEPWALAWPCVYEFLRVVSHPRVFEPPTPIERAIADLESLLDSPALVLLGEGPRHRGHLRRVVEDAEPAGNLVHDAHIVALAIEHGVDEILTLDRDFSRFGGIRARNPFRRKADR